jgi:hypothetical protein
MQKDPHWLIGVEDWLWSVSFQLSLSFWLAAPLRFKEVSCLIPQALPITLTESSRSGQLLGLFL